MLHVIYDYRASKGSLLYQCTGVVLHDKILGKLSKS